MQSGALCFDLGAPCASRVSHTRFVVFSVRAQSIFVEAGRLKSHGIATRGHSHREEEQSRDDIVAVFEHLS